jgi:hypothetical protein
MIHIVSWFIGWGSVLMFMDYFGIETEGWVQGLFMIIICSGLSIFIGVILQNLLGRWLGD